jgi:adenylate cyclase
MKISSSSTASKFIQGLLIGLLFALPALYLFHAKKLDLLEYKTWDLRVKQFAAARPSSDQIRLILLDQYSLDWGSKTMSLPWPWPREVYKPILDFCARGGAKVVAFDLLFTEPSFKGVEDDARLAEGILAVPEFIGAAQLSRSDGAFTHWTDDTDNLHFPRIRVDPAFSNQLDQFTFPTATLPIPEVLTNATALANVAGNPDRDSIYRRISPLARFDGRWVPALGFSAYLAGSGSQSNILHLTSQGLLLKGNRLLPLDHDGQVILRFRGASQTHRAFNAAAIIQSELACQAGTPPPIDPKEFRDKYVFFGTTAPGLYDLRPTPISAVYPGVEIHATLLDNLLEFDSLRDTPTGWVIGLTLLLTLLAAGIARICRSSLQILALAIPIVLLPWVLGCAAYTRGYWLPMVVLWTGSLPALIAVLGVNYAVEGRQKRYLKNAFRQYLSPIVIDQLVAHPERLRLGGELKELTIFFSDVQGFTSISEKLAPQPLTEFLNTYLTGMTNIILKEGGTVDKYEGDAIIAFWNAPTDQADHAQRGVRAALRCQALLAEKRDEWEARYGSKIFMRVGMNTGQVVVGNMGSDQRFDYTFLGDAGNLAARLEGINKKFGTYYIISEATRNRLGSEFHGREISRITVVGRREPVRIFEPVTEETAALNGTLYAGFAAALQDYYAGRFGEAHRKFGALQDQDPTSARYVAQCEELILHPPKEWMGVWSMTEK